MQTLSPRWFEALYSYNIVPADFIARWGLDLLEAGPYGKWIEPEVRDRALDFGNRPEPEATLVEIALHVFAFCYPASTLYRAGLFLLGVTETVGVDDPTEEEVARVLELFWMKSQEEMQRYFRVARVDRALRYDLLTSAEPRAYRERLWARVRAVSEEAVLYADPDSALYVHEQDHDYWTTDGIQAIDVAVRQFADAWDL